MHCLFAIYYCEQQEKYVSSLAFIKPGNSIFGMASAYFDTKHGDFLAMTAFACHLCWVLELKLDLIT
jgi:glyoxylate utilization-related uncharacterized protein